jgi:hypothetical protein
LRYLDIQVVVTVAAHVAVVHLAPICHMYMTGGMWCHVIMTGCYCM